MTSKWNGMKINLSGSKAKITPAPIKPNQNLIDRFKDIQIDDFCTIITKSKRDYDGQIISLTPISLTILWFNVVKDRLDEIEFSFDQIEKIIKAEES